LEAEPFIINLGGTDIRLVPFRPLQDSVNVHKKFQKALELSLESGEWQNWPQLLRGAHSARLNILSGWTEKFLKKALEADQLPLIMRIINHEWSPISLAKQDTRTSIMIAIREAAARSSWDYNVTLENLNRAEQLNRLSGLSVHGGQRHGFSDPYMTLVPFELSAKLATAKSSDQATKSTAPEAVRAASDGNVSEVPAPPRNYQDIVKTYAPRFFSSFNRDRSWVRFH
jgi:hypothetical protein